MLYRAPRPHEQDVMDYGWSAADVDPSELVDDDWIAANTKLGKKPNKVRHVAAKALGRLTLQPSGFTRDQMRRIAARTGYPYVEAWSNWNRGWMTGVWGALCHHTGTSWSAPGDYPTLRVVRDGRPGLENSLCAFGLGRSGTTYLISEKVSWHAGVGNVNGLTDGNGKLAGIEAESDGVHWTPEEIDAYPRLVASILVEIRQDDRYTTRHASYALPTGRKVDFAGWPGGTDPFWAKVYEYLAHPERIDRNWRPGFGIGGSISACYNRVNGPALLGLARGPEVPTADGVGRWQEFERGIILWHPAVVRGEAHELHGEILKRFRKVGSEMFIGYPTTDERTTPDGVGRYNHFVKGASIYWHPKYGAHMVLGPIREAWAKAGWERGWGYPTTEPTETDQNFEQGTARIEGTVVQFYPSGQA